MKLVFAASLLSMQHDEERALGSNSNDCWIKATELCKSEVGGISRGHNCVEDVEI
jgi:hypothetical protein